MVWRTQDSPSRGLEEGRDRHLPMGASQASWLSRAWGLLPILLLLPPCPSLFFPLPPPCLPHHPLKRRGREGRRIKTPLFPVRNLLFPFCRWDRWVWWWVGVGLDRQGGSCLGMEETGSETLPPHLSPPGGTELTSPCNPFYACLPAPHVHCTCHMPATCTHCLFPLPLFPSHHCTCLLFCLPAAACTCI